LIINVRDRDRSGRATRASATSASAGRSIRSGRRRGERPWPSFWPVRTILWPVRTILWPVRTIFWPARVDVEHRHCAGHRRRAAEPAMWCKNDDAGVSGLHW